jgi:hypothetical protein
VTLATAHEHAASAPSKVTEEPGYWVIHDAVATEEAVLHGQYRLENGTLLRGPAYKPWDELKRGAKGIEGKPLVLGHTAQGQEHVYLGVGKNVRVDDGRHRVVYDWWLYREPSADARATAAAIEANRRIVERVRSGQAVGNSPDYRFRVDAHAGEWRGQPFNLIVRDHAYDYIAILPDTEAACPVPRCGAGVENLNPGTETEEKAKAEEERWLDRIAGGFRRAFPNLVTATPAATGAEQRSPNGGTTMDEKELNTACAEMQKALGTEAATPASLIAGARKLKTDHDTALQKATDLEQRATAAEGRLKTYEEAEKKEVEALAAECAKRAGKDEAYAKKIQAFGKEALLELRDSLSPRGGGRLAPHIGAGQEGQPDPSGLGVVGDQLFVADWSKVAPAGAAPAGGRQ